MRAFSSDEVGMCIVRIAVVVALFLSEYEVFVAKDIQTGLMSVSLYINVKLYTQNLNYLFTYSLYNTISIDNKDCEKRIKQ